MQIHRFTPQCPQYNFNNSNQDLIKGLYMYTNLYYLDDYRGKKNNSQRKFLDLVNSINTHSNHLCTIYTNTKMQFIMKFV